MRWLLVVTLFIVAACGPQARQRAINTAHEALNTLTDAADPTYELAVATCDAQAQVILGRQGTTLEQDTASLRSLQASCNDAFAIFEQIREKQMQARRILDGLERGDALALLVEARRLWGDLRSLLVRTGLIESRQVPELRPWDADEGATP